MRYFQQIAAGVDPLPLLHALALQPHLWNSNKTRTWHPQSAHRVVDDVLLRYNDFDADRGDDFVERVCSEIHCINLPAFAALPQAVPIVFGLMARVSGEHLGRVFISRMAPGICIPPHSDRIAPAEEAFPDKIPPAVYFARYQVALKASPGVIFRAGDEEVFMEPGTIWHFDNTVTHEVLNHSRDDRISLVIDIRPFRP
jgi:Aspartyl/Asparaginyl beta-hydroxylase